MDPWNPDEVPKYFLQPGFIFVSKEPHLIHTVLGSCVAICIWDQVGQFGGMNHYIYDRAKKERSARYGDVSIPHLVRMMLEMGSKKFNLKVHILGGAQNPQLGSSLGRLNAQLAVDYFEHSPIEVLSKDVGGVLGRKVVFNNLNGEIMVFKLKKIREDDWFGGPV
ncbi:MAG TPA: chemotaxis protein CheD [Thermotogota bacterium]|nr:chemotaxis protein CheD [Thermotogota bacterium]HRW91458.1 chemotaxis protein CheD [Thermotogota bacterium]